MSTDYLSEYRKLAKDAIDFIQRMRPHFGSGPGSFTYRALKTRFDWLDARERDELERASEILADMADKASATEITSTLETAP